MGVFVRAIFALLMFVVFGLVSSGVGAQQALPIKADAGETIRLDPTGAATLPSTAPLAPSWQWIARPAGSVAAFSDAAALRPEVTLDQPGTYVARVNFLEPGGAIAASAEITFGSENLAPVAQTRLRGVPQGESPVTLDGAASFDVDGDALSYAWTIAEAPAGSGASLGNADQPVARGFLDLEGDYVFALTVQDAQGQPSAPDLITVTYLPNSGSTDVYRSVYDMVRTATASLAETFDLGERQTETGGHELLGGFEFGTGAGSLGDTIQVSLGGTVHMASEPAELLALIDVLLLDADPTTTVQMSPNESVGDLTLIFGLTGGSLTLSDVIGADLTRVQLEGHGVAVYEGTAGRQAAPVASGRFDQLPGVAGETLELEAYGSTDIDGSVLAAAANPIVSPAGATPLLATNLDGIFSFTPGVAGDYLLAIDVSDTLFDDQAQVLVAAGADDNVRPVAVIEPVRNADLAERLVIDGSQSYDLNGDLITHGWALLSAPSGSTSTLEEDRTGFVALTPDQPGDYIVQLQVADADVAGVPQTVLIRVPDVYPVAEAGPDRAAGDFGTLSLDGTLSTGTGALNYAWSSLGLTGDGSSAMITGANTAMPDLTLDIREGRFRDVIRLANVYHFKRSNTGGFCNFDTRTPVDLPGTSASEMIQITLHSRGRQAGLGGDILVWEIENKKDHTRQVLLRDADGVEHGTYTVPGRTSVHVTSQDIGNARMYAAVEDTDQADDRAKNNPFSRNNPVCTGPGAGVVQLIVADGGLASLPDTTFIGNGNLRPTLASGPKFELVSGETVDLDARIYGTDPDGDALSYGWSLIARPEGSAATVTPLTAGPLLTFAPDRVGVYLLQVTADDGSMIAVPAVIEVEVINSPPIAGISGDTVAFVGETAVIEGSTSFDPDGDALSYAWTLISQPTESTAVLTGADQPNISFSPDRRGDYVFRLIVSDYEFDSDPVTRVLTAPNRAPVAALTGEAEIDVDAEQIYSAAASSDPDNDPLTYTYAVIAQPAGSSPFVSDLGQGEFGFVADQPGNYTLEVTVSDGLLTSVATLDVSARPRNTAPVLRPINPLYTVELGLQLSLDLVGSDPDGDAITFFANPLPLADGISVDGSTGEVRFRPEQGQVGSYSFTVGVSDGVLTDQAVLNIQVVEADFGDTAIFGRVLDAEDFAEGIITPLPDMPVRLRDAALMTTTAADGSFDFGSLTAGRDQIIIEPPVDTGSVRYLSTLRAITVTANQNRDLAPDFLLVPLDDGCQTVVPGQDTVLSSSTSGIGVTIAADTIQNTTGGAYTGEVCLGSLLDRFEHPGFDDYTQACRLWALDAPGAIFTQGMTVTGPNLDNLPEETQLEMWRVSDLSGLFRRTAKAGVDAGGATVSGTLTRFEQSTLFTFLPQAPRTVVSANQPTGMRTLTPFEGDNSTTYTLPGYTAFGQDQQVGLAYHSHAANPTIVVAGDVTIADNASLPETMVTRIDMGGLSVGDTRSWTPRQGLDGSTPALVGEELTLRQTLPVDGSGLASGRYEYRFISQAQYECSTVGATHQADLYVQNEAESPYGNGWSIDGLQKLIVNPDGAVAIIDDDTVTPFDPVNDFTEFDDEPLVLPGFGVEDLMVADFDNNGTTDIAWPDSGTGSLVIALNNGERDVSITNSVVVSAPSDVPDTGQYPPNLLASVAVDYSGDGILDIVHSSQTSRKLGVAEGDGFGDFANRDIANARPSDFKLIDLDGDGYEDIVTPGRTGFFIIRANVTVYFGGPDGFTEETVLKFDSGVRSRVGGLQLEVEDLDGDGRIDVAVRSRQGIDIAFNNGDRNFTRDLPKFGLDGENLLGEFMKFADLDGDGLSDLVWSSRNRLEVHRNLGNRSFAEPVPLARPVSSTTSAPIALFDVDRDDDIDILISQGTPLYVLPGIGDGTFEPALATDFGHGINKLVVADVDGDGGLDLISSQRFSVTVDFSRPSDDGRYVSGSGDFSTLVALPDGGWERRYKDGTTVVFDANGRQTAEVDTYGQRRSYAYDPEGRLLTITDQVGGQTVFDYGAEGLLESITYPDGRITTFDYDDSVRLTNVQEPTGSQVSFAYDENNRLISTTNQNANATLYTYDGVGNLSGATLPDGSNVNNQVAASLGLVDGLGGLAAQPLAYVAPEDRATIVTDRKGEVTEITVNEFGSIIQTVDPLGRVTKMERNEDNLIIRIERPSDVSPDGVRVDTITFDNLANVLSMTEAAGTSAERSMSYTYEPVFNKVLTMTDGDGFVTTYEYDASGGLTRTIDPEGGSEVQVYTAEGKLASRTDKNGNVTAFAYNAQQNLDTVTYADGSVTQMTYDATGNTTMIAEAAGTPIERQVQRTYDALNRVLTVEVTGADGAQIDGVTQYSYLPGGNLATVTDETGLVTSMGYDGLERLVALDDPAEGLIRRTYNEAGEVIEHINGDDEVHQYAYDSVSRLTQTTDPEGFVKSFSYDTRDNIQTVTDGGGGVTTFGYDTRDRMLTRTNPIGQTMTRSYDARDNLGTLTREDGTVETATYDGLSRRTQVVTPDNTLTYAYDARGNLIEAADDDSRVTFTYDLRNRLETTTTDGTVGPQPQVTLTYTYDQLDRRLSMSDSLGGTTTYAYDPEDRLTELTAPWGTVYNFGYDGEGRRTSLTSTSGRVSNYGYTNGLLTALSHAQSGVALTDLTYEYDVDGQLTAILDAIDPEKSKFISYDDLNRLVQVDEGIPPIQGGTPLPVEDYAYDEEGNRTASHLSAFYSSNDHNQLLEDDQFTYAYDAKGNRVSKTSKADGTVETYTYDSQNRLVGYASPTATASYAYDALERRVAKVVNGAGIAYIYNISNENALAQNDIVLEFDGTGTPVLHRRWAHSTSIDEPLGFEEYHTTSGAGSGSAQVMFQDRQNSVIWIIDEGTTQITAAYEYDSFGKVSQTVGSLEQPFAFTGREYDAESGLYYYRLRSFDPDAGSFLQSDVLGFGSGGFSLYRYVENSPFNFTDPTGAVSMDYRAQLGMDGANSLSSVAVTGMAILELANVAIQKMKIDFNVPVQTMVDAASPGGCSKKTHDALRALVDKQAPACQFGLDPIVNLRRMQVLVRTMLGRRALSIACYDGGNPGHIGEAYSLMKPIKDCHGILTRAPTPRGN